MQDTPSDVYFQLPEEAYTTPLSSEAPLSYDFHFQEPQDAIVNGIEAEKPKGRHKFTREECQRGFWAAIESITARYPDHVNSAGMHMACFFLKKKGARA